MLGIITWKFECSYVAIETLKECILNGHNPKLQLDLNSEEYYLSGNIFVSSRKMVQ